MHYFNRTQRVRLVEGRLCREVYATAKGSKAPRAPLAVFREWEDGSTECRNLVYSSIAGWLFIAPDDPHDEGGRYGVEPWAPGGPKNGACWDHLTPEDAETIKAARPAFRWCLDKAVAAGYTGVQIFELLRTFSRAPEVELLVGAGLHRLAHSSGLLRLSAATQKRVIAWASTRGDFGLSCAMACLKHGIEPEAWEKWQASHPKMSYPEWAYAEARGVPRYEYLEYLTAARNVGKDLKDPYWHFPGDFAARRRAVERIASNRKKRETRQRAEALRRIAGAFKRAVVGGFSVWVPATFAEFKAQAKALHQCLVDMDYATKVIKGECVLVFLGTACGPTATCELRPVGNSWRIGQFYGDEEKKDYLATAEERAALAAWAKRNRLKLRAA